ncbi:uncharacterized protein [Asterias amurensis]|uniref:uncharacterized protein n=1 Tax=Asterias amurensis TaxID=7602 RepID=UPI003AB4B7BC
MIKDRRILGCITQFSWMMISVGAVVALFYPNVASSEVCYIHQSTVRQGVVKWVAPPDPCSCKETRVGGLNTVEEPEPPNGFLNDVLFTRNEEKLRAWFGCPSIEVPTTAAVLTTAADSTTAKVPTAAATGGVSITSAVPTTAAPTVAATAAVLTTAAVTPTTAVPTTAAVTPTAAVPTTAAVTPTAAVPTTAAVTPTAAATDAVPTTAAVTPTAADSTTAKVPTAAATGGVSITSAVPTTAAPTAAATAAVPTTAAVTPTAAVPTTAAVTPTAAVPTTAAVTPTAAVPTTAAVTPTAAVPTTAAVTPTAAVPTTAAVTPTAAVPTTAAVTPTAAVPTTAAVTPTAAVPTTAAVTPTAAVPTTAAVTPTAAVPTTAAVTPTAAATDAVPTTAAVTPTAAVPTTDAALWSTDCADILSNGTDDSGLYTVYPHGTAPGVTVYCDMDTGVGGWIVFQRRHDGSVDFNRDWLTYRNGFGNMSGEFWLGNNNLRRLTGTNKWELRVDLVAWDGTKAYSRYGSFEVRGDEYTLLVADKKPGGGAGDSLNHHNGSDFSTWDRDNDGYHVGSCAKAYQGAWWYSSSCGSSRLNGPYREHADTVPGDGQGIIWSTFKGVGSLKECEMKIRQLP